MNQLSDNPMDHHGKLNPGPDFRRNLYDRYVSSFKQAQASLSSPDQVSYEAWCSRCYWPLFQDIDRASPILEIGCGAGYFMEFLQRRGFLDVTGLDISEEQVALARGRALHAEVADVFEFLPAHRDAFEAIVAIDFLEHFARDELIKLVPVIRDALRPGGCFITQTPNGQGLHAGAVIHGDLTHLTIFTPRSLEQLLRFGGFSDIVCLETALPGTTVSWFARRVVWSLVRHTANAIKRVEGGRTQAIWTQNFICAARSPSSSRSPSD